LHLSPRQQNNKINNKDCDSNWRNEKCFFFLHLENENCYFKKNKQQILAKFNFYFCKIDE